MSRIDLHMHTLFSDGTCQPEELVGVAYDQGLDAIAITDHDNTGCLERARQAAADKAAASEDKREMEIIPGIEINTVWTEYGHQEVHVLGYYINPDDENLKSVINRHKQARVEQIQEIAQKLRDVASVNVQYDDIVAHAAGSLSIGRPHVAKAIVQKGGAATISDAFNRFLNSSSPTYVRRATVSPHEAVEAIYESGGIAVIAHPKEMEHIEELVVDLMNYGLRGLEAYHKSHSPAIIEFHSSLAEKYGLIVTGGTDFHGPAENYPKTLGNWRMPDFVYAKLKAESQMIQESGYKAS